MRKLVCTSMLVLLLVTMPLPAAAKAPVSVTKGSITLSGGYDTGHFDEYWDLKKGDLTIAFTYDARGLVDDAGTHAWAQLGVRSPCDADFNPTSGVEGSGVWLGTDYDWLPDTFEPDPEGSPGQDMDDKLILQKGEFLDEGYYNLPSTPPNKNANHAVWFDRDGVNQSQAQLWGAIDGVTYNTGGIYAVVIRLQATSDSTGEAYMTVNGQPQGFYAPAWYDGPPDLMPAGLTFSGDMRHLQVFYGLKGYGAQPTVMFKNITLVGMLHDRRPGETPFPSCG